MTMVTDRCGLGREIGHAETLCDDAPYARLMLIHHEHGDIYWVYTSERTDRDAIEAIWPLIPTTIRYDSSEPCRFGFGRDVKLCVVHYLIAKKGELIESRLTAEKFFATQRVGLF